MRFWVKAPPGASVKLKGRWPEVTNQAAMVDCVYTAVTLPEAFTLTAEDLAKAFVDKDATTEKYDNKYVLLTGKIKGIDTVTADKYLDSTLTAEFENAGDTRLYANVDLPPVNANFDLLDAKGKESASVWAGRSRSGRPRYWWTVPREESASVWARRSRYSGSAHSRSTARRESLLTAASWWHSPSETFEPNK